MRIGLRVQALILLFFLMGFCATAKAEVIAQSGPGRVALLEVYSSEGCSSCPPAEEWVSRLASDPGLWKKFVPAVFHVDYWDYLGWKDPFAAHAYTERQYATVSAWHADSVYTPGFVLNGDEWRDWHLGRSVEGGTGGDPGELRVESVSDGRYRAVFSPKAGGGPWRVHAALLGFNLVTDVLDGENAGRHLRHDFLVLGYTESPMRPAQGAFESEIVLPDSPAPGKKALAVWVSAGDALAPVQAAGAYLDQALPKGDY